MEQKITPNLWFNGDAKQAIDYYASVFPDSAIGTTAYYPNTPEEGLADFQLDMAGKVLTIEFALSGQHFTAINADATFKFTEAISFVVGCKDQAEIDYFWDKLSSDPASEQCGWCKDQFGLSWQIVPENIAELLARPGAYANMMQMKKLVIADF